MSKGGVLEWLLIVPVLAVALLMVQAEYRTEQGQMYTVPVNGFDPRDLVYGHYLSIQVDLEALGVRAGGTKDGGAFCFQREGESVRVLQGTEMELAQENCASITPTENLVGAKRYLVPEVDALELENRLRDQKVKASVELIIQESGEVSMGMLFLNDKPWREVLAEPNP